jgi:hypothetical protein
MIPSAFNENSRADQLMLSKSFPRPIRFVLPPRVGHPRNRLFSGCVMAARTLSGSCETHLTQVFSCRLVNTFEIPYEVNFMRAMRVRLRPGFLS